MEDSDSPPAATKVWTSASPPAAVEVLTSSASPPSAATMVLTSPSPPAAMEVATTSASPLSAIPSRTTGISEGEIQRLIGDLKGLSSSISELTQGLEQLRSPLVAVSEMEDPSITAKCWTKQVRKLCYDTGDYLYDVMHSGNEFKLLGSRALNASGGYKQYEAQPEAPSKSMVRRLPATHKDLIDNGDKAVEVAKLMGTDKKLKVVSILGSEGVGKTTLAKRLYVNGGFECRAFLRASPKPDIRRLLTSMFMQIQRKRPSCRLNAYKLIDSIARYLRNRRYFIIIDDLWTTAVWEIISRAFPDGDCGSRIITTTQIRNVALLCCGHQSKYVFKILPLNDVQSRKLFFGIVFGSESACPGDLAEVSDGIIKRCGGLPLAIINIASMLPSALSLEQWTGLRDYLPSNWSKEPTSEWMKEVANLIFSTLRPHLKTCLLYFSMYPEGYIVMKDDLIRQWVVEGVLDGIEGQATEEVAGDYFDELICRGLIQSVDFKKNGTVLSCTLHHIIHDVIVNKSMEENFVIIADYFQSAIPLPDKVRRLSVQFGGARSAYIPESVMVSEVRSLAFFGFLQCFLSASTVKFRHVRVLILHIWADDDKRAFDLSGISELRRLRYLKISCNIAVKLPEEIQGQQYLETLEVHATVVAIPWDIGGLSRLSSLKIAVTKLSTNNIIYLQILPALTELSLHLKTAPTETIVLDEGGFLNLKFFTFRCSAPRLLIEKKAMPKIEKLNLYFNAHEAHRYGTRPITIEHLASLKEISMKIQSAVGGEGPVFVDAFVSNNKDNPSPDVELMESRQDKETGTLEEQDEIMKEGTHEYPRTQEEGSAECEKTDDGRDETQDAGSSRNDNKDADSRISMPIGSSSRPPVPVGWGIATAGWILSPIFARLVDKALCRMGPDELNENVSKLASQVIPQLKLTVEAAESSEDMLFFEELVKKLKSYFYELEETLDELEYDRLESQLTERNKHEHAQIHDAGLSKQGVAIGSSQKSPESVTNCLADNLKKIEQALEKAHDNIKLKKPPRNGSTERRLEVKDRHKTTSGEARVQVIGRDKHLKKISQLLHYTKDGVDSRAGRQQLYGVTCSMPLSIIGIYGMAGSGKTTLAQHVYQSEKKTNNFVHLMWIHVSRNFSVADIFREMLQQVDDGENPLGEGGSLRYMSVRLKENLSQGRFLLVLDDIWCDKDSDKYKLYELFSVLPLGYKESKVLVTSRNKNVVSAIGFDVEDTTIEIEDLSENDFSSLLMSHALGGNMIDVGVKESLEGIGDHIVKRLNASPLAAALVGGLLRKEMTVDHWVRVKDDPYLSKGIMGILLLCYQHLDEQARRCFAYCSIFPRRHRFSRDELVKLWVAEGFIEGKSAGEMEEIGDCYFGELVSTSFLQLGEKDSNCGKEYFFVHELLHDIAEQVGGSDFFRIEDGWRGEVPLDVRHLFVQTSYRFLTKDVVKLEKLRSLIILSGETNIGSEMLTVILENRIRLRKLRVVLVVERDSYVQYSLPASIGDLKHIRYLAFRWGFHGYIDLPDALAKLYHMQVLDFGDCKHFSISGDIRLTNLRQLMVRGAFRNVGRLESLENLPFFHISEDEGSELSQLSSLHKLRGKLQIVGLEQVKSMDEALEAKLADKEGLRELVLEWDDLGFQVSRVIENVLEGLCPSEHLEELGIICYQGKRYPNWMVVDQHRSWRVQRLVLRKCSPLVTGSSPFFANLLRLTFQDCEWESLPDHMKHLRKLTVLIIYKCNEIKSLGKLPQSLKYLEICRCENTFMKSYKNDPSWNEKTKGIRRKFIGYPRLQDSSEYPNTSTRLPQSGELPKVMALEATSASLPSRKQSGKLPVVGHTSPESKVIDPQEAASTKQPSVVLALSDKHRGSSSDTSPNAKDNETSTPLPSGKKRASNFLKRLRWGRKN